MDKWIQTYKALLADFKTSKGSATVFSVILIVGSQGSVCDMLGTRYLLHEWITWMSK